MQGRFLGLGAIAAAAAAVLVGTQLASARSAGPSKPAAAPTTTCSLGKDGKIQHVIYIQFDNTHLRRDNPNVPSDLEQMPNLKNFLENNGTLLSNDHTVLISHTATGILSSLTGVYPDRFGQPVSNSSRYFTPAGISNTAVAFAYWTAPLFDPGPTGNTTFPPARQTDFTPEMINENGKVAPAPWVPYTRAGCDVGAIATANTILENTAIDVPTVFGAGSPEAAQVASDSPGSSATQSFADFVGIGIHCSKNSALCGQSTHQRADILNDEPNDPVTGQPYTGFNGIFGARYVNPLIKPSGPMTDLDNNVIKDQNNHIGFPGFDGMVATVSLSWTLQMQKAGVPVTFAYISDAHDGHGNSGNIHHTYGPGEQGYVQQLQDYDKAFGQFFGKLADAGITKQNTLFVVTVDEGDHFVGSAPKPSNCDGVNIFCTYDNVGEINADIRRMIRTQFGDTTSFSVHSDDAPNFYVDGTPAQPIRDRTDPIVRQLERESADLSWLNPYTNKIQDDITQGLADPVEERTLHMVTADPFRTPTFTLFADPDWFFFATGGAACPTPVACASIPPQNDQSFAWNHGDIQDDIASTWVGYVGPGVQTHHQWGKVWTDHTDVRPTMLTLLGLKDDYQTDGRAVTEIMQGGAMPKHLDQGRVAELGAVYKQIMASFGQFAMDTLAASTQALGSYSVGDKTYTDTENAIEGLTNERNALAASIRTALNNAEFNGQKLDQKQAKDWIDKANDLLDRAHALAASFSSNEEAKKLRKIKHFVVIYEENHSFDNLFGSWEGVNGLNNVNKTGVGDHVTQIDQNGVAYNCLKQLDVNLTSPPLSSTCTDTANGHNIPASHFQNTWFTIDDFLQPTDRTCPPLTNLFGFTNGIDKTNPVAGARTGGCTRDLRHEFYQEQYQLHGGAQDRYMVGSDSAGTTMGVYDTTKLPIYAYLHEKGHPDYAIADNFFQAAFGGSFLNHQWLIAAATPVDPTGSPGGAHEGIHALIDSNGMPEATTLYTPTGTVARSGRPLTVTCPAPPPAQICGNYAVNTMLPFAPPSATFSPVIPAQNAPTIGDRLTDAGIDWAWYAGGWNDAVAGHADPTFQPQHQPFAYYTNYGPSGSGRSHLQDETDFSGLVGDSDEECQLKPVSFVKPIGEENEHPGYASTPDGNTHLTNMLRAIENSSCAKDTMVIVTYDEFGGEWDHVSPPGQGNDNGPHDVWGPGTRVPALIIAPHLKHNFVVDSEEHDTTSILATLEHRYGLDPLGSRDAVVNDLSTIFDAKKP